MGLGMYNTMEAWTDLPRWVCLANKDRALHAVRLCNHFCCIPRTCRAGHSLGPQSIGPLCNRANHDRNIPLLKQRREGKKGG